MRLKHLHFKCTIILLFGFCTSAISSEPASVPTITPIPQLNLGYSEFAPYTYTDDQGKIAGEVGKVIEHIVKDAGFAFTSSSGPNRRLYRGILTDQIDLMLVVPFEDEHSNQIIFGEKVFDQLDMALFWLTEKARPLSDISELNKKHLIVIAGYSYGGLFKEPSKLQNNKLFLAENHQQALKALTRKRAPYLLAYKKNIMFYQRALATEPLSSNTLQSIPLVLSIRKNYPDAKNVLKDLERRFAALYPDQFMKLNSK